jgi:hypothetical protein
MFLDSLTNPSDVEKRIVSDVGDFSDQANEITVSAPFLRALVA